MGRAGGPFLLRVIGTAGHVDHGKSTLIEALTGIDPDRLQEEKDRGMTIDLGFAWLRLPSGQEVSIVDVPGHERFIKNMLAGVGGIDIALLVVAADEGIMPQTREHLAILDLLEVGAGVVAITKMDLVDEEWLGLVSAEVEEVIASTALREARLIPVSALTGQGLPDLAAELDNLLSHERHRRQTGWPRLPIDRIFTMPGFGTVVTGTLIDGELRIGQEIELVPSGHRARVRGLQSHRKWLDQAPAGTRVAVNVAGLALDDIERGEILTAPGWLTATRAVDVRLRIVADAPKPLLHNAEVSFHTGATEALGRVGLLDHDRLEPGAVGWAQIRLDRPVGAVRGDPFIIRSPSANLTVGGGTVVDEHPKRHRRYQERVLEQLTILDRGSPAEQAVQALQSREPAELGELALRLGKTPDELVDLLAGMIRDQTVLSLGTTPSGGRGGAQTPGSPDQPVLPGTLLSGTLLISSDGWKRLAGRAQAELETYHGEHPLRRGIPREEVRGRLGLDTRTFPRAEMKLIEAGIAATDGPFLHLPSHQVSLDAEIESRVAAMAQALDAAGASPPDRAAMINAHALTDEILQVLIDRGALVEVATDLVYTRETYDKLLGEVRALIAGQGPSTVAEVRDRLGTSRKYALAILEHLDQKRVTRRVGDQRVLV
ncbi:MAG: selenocysteine-specific translation elongation factor [Chloroflexi bacterium]|nr:selenocysteine-specific translation elongation factor [Chloroflexota bacterium]